MRVRVLDVPTPRAGTPTLDGQPRPGRLAADAARIGALVLSSGSEPIAFVDNSVNALIASLAGGRTRDIDRFGTVIDAASGRSDAYALVFDPSGSRNSYHLAKIDLSSLRVTATIDTGIRPHDGAIDDRAQLNVDERGQLWVYASQVVAGTHRSKLVRIDPDLRRAESVSVPSGSGSRFSVGADGRLYLFGGPAENRISSFDPATSQMTSTALRTPSSSFVLSVFAR